MGYALRQTQWSRSCSLSRRKRSWARAFQWLGWSYRWKDQLLYKRNHCQLFEERPWTNREWLRCRRTTKLWPRRYQHQWRWRSRVYCPLGTKNCRIFCNTAHPSRSSCSRRQRRSCLSNSSSSSWSNNGWSGSFIWNSDPYGDLCNRGPGWI